MRRSNTTIVKNRIREYIYEHFDEEFLAVNDKPCTRFYEQMCEEWWFGYEKQRAPNKYEAFIGYMQGLPNNLSIAFTYHAQRIHVKMWLDETDEEAARYTDDKVCALFYHLVSMEFYRMLDREIKQ